MSNSLIDGYGGKFMTAPSCFSAAVVFYVNAVRIPA